MTIRVEGFGCTLEDLGIGGDPVALGLRVLGVGAGKGGAACVLRRVASVARRYAGGRVDAWGGGGAESTVYMRVWVRKGSICGGRFDLKHILRYLESVICCLRLDTDSP